jgi:hypothetical protein
MSNISEFMFSVNPRLTSIDSSKPVLLWLDQHVLTQKNLENARKTLIEAQKLAPEFERLDHCLQSTPWHCEGLFVRFHVERILAGLFGILDGQSLLAVDEFIGDKYWREEVIKLEETIRANAATLQAFALLHDLAKPSLLAFDALPDARGAREGFAQHKHRLSVAASPAEQTLYLKLFRAFEAAHPDLTSADLSVAFFNEYGIETHYFGHARAVLKSEFRRARTAIENQLKLTPVDAEILAFAMENHIDVLDFFRKGPDVSKFELLVARATKAKLDADGALDLLLAGVFLDSALGSLCYQNGNFLVDLTAIFNFWRSEELAAPARRAKRREEVRLQQKRAFKALLKSAGLSSDEVFKLLNVPFGRGRKQVVESLEELVKDPSLPVPENLKDKEVQKRLHKAQQLFDAARITWENGAL